MSGDTTPLIAHDARPDRAPLVPAGGIDAHGPDMTATFAADVSLGTAQARLAELNQWLPIDGCPDAPLGNLVEANSTGPLRLGYGAWRDLLLGVQFRNGPGELITAGGRTVKNVAGYDLTKLMVGQHGMFGQIVTITTRTYQRPEAALHVAWGEPMAIGRLLPTPLRPHWAMRASAIRLTCGYLGSAATIEFYRRLAGAERPAAMDVVALEADVERRAAEWSFPEPRGYRASVPPASILPFLEAAQGSGTAAGGRPPVADAAFGIIVGAVRDDEHARSLREAAANLGGTIQFPDRRPGVTCAIDFSTTPGQRRIIEALKRAFDPQNRLAPLPWRHL